MAATTTCQRPQRYRPRRAAQICAADVVDEPSQLPARAVRHQCVLAAVPSPGENGELPTSSVLSVSTHPRRHPPLFLLDHSEREGKRASERAGFSQFWRLHSETMGPPPCLYIHMVQSCQGGIPPLHPTNYLISFLRKRSAAGAKRSRVNGAEFSPY